MNSTRFENTTSQGNVKAFRIEVTECPNSNAGKAHAKLINELRDGSETTRDGKYFPTLEGAAAHAANWISMCEKTPGLVRV